MKFIDKTLTEQTITNVSPGTDLLPVGDSTLMEIPQGTSESERIGRKCILKKIMIRIDIEMIQQDNSSFTEDTIRLVLFEDHQCNGIQASLSGLLQAPVDTYSFRQMAVSRRFRVLWDQTLQLNNLVGAGNGTTNNFGRRVYHMERYYNLNLPLNFKFATGDVSELQENNVVFTAISKHGRCTLKGKIRLRFIG